MTFAQTWQVGRQLVCAGRAAVLDRADLLRGGGHDARCDPDDSRQLLAARGVVKPCPAVTRARPGELRGWLWDRTVALWHAAGSLAGRRPEPDEGDGRP